MVTWTDLSSTFERWLFAAGPGGFWLIVASAAVIYLVALIVVRVGKKRFIGTNSVFDAILGFMLGSTLSRTINGTAPLLATVAAALVLVALHWLVGEIATRTDTIGRLVAGSPHVLVQDGKLDDKELHRHNLTHADLEQALLTAGVAEGVEHVEIARFERNGAISVVPKRFARIVEIKVEEGVQTVRVLLEGRE